MHVSTHNYSTKVKSPAHATLTIGGSQDLQSKISVSDCSNDRSILEVPANSCRPGWIHLSLVMSLADYSGKTEKLQRGCHALSFTIVVSTSVICRETIQLS
jgi:hypothetical protein